MGWFTQSESGRARRTPLTPVEQLEQRDQPAASVLANMSTTGAPAFSFYDQGGPGPDGAALGGHVYFLAADGAANPGLYKSDGTVAGTTLVRDITPPAVAMAGDPRLGQLFPNTNPVVAAGGKLYFAAGPTGSLWVSDGTSNGTRPVVEPVAGATFPVNATPIAEMGGRLVFAAADSSPTNPYLGRELWATDGTPGGTVVLSKAGGNFRSPAVTGGKLYYVTQANHASPNGPDFTIWVSDGTAAGTKVFVALPAGTQADDFSPEGQWAVAAGGKLYFAAGSAGYGTELWVSDGTAAGTKLVKDVNPTQSDPLFGGGFTYPRSSHPQQFTLVGSTVFFAADDGEHGQELWATDGTEAGTKMVKDLSPGVGSPWYELTGQPSGSQISGLTAVNGKLYFGADDGVSGRQLYVSNGTEVGTAKLTASTPAQGGYPNPFVTDPTPLLEFNGRLLFAQMDAATGRQLWTTDGTTAGTKVVRAIGAQETPTERFLAGPVALGVANGKLLFAADDGVAGQQLWATDGTAAGTAAVKRLNPNDLGSDPESFVSIGSRVVFAGSDKLGGLAVFATDGTSAPVVLARMPVAADPTAQDEPQRFTRSGDKAYFVARVGATGRQLWVTNGTPAGTRVVKEVVVPPVTGPAVASGIDNPTDVAGTLYFTVELPESGQELWASDGTAAGTRKVKAIGPMSSSAGLFEPPVVSRTTQLTAVGNRLYFTADGGTTGAELWVSDGTAAGTKLVRDILPGATGSAPTDLTALNGKAYFTADDGTRGRQLWVSDGTATGTKLAATVAIDAPPGVLNPPPVYYSDVPPPRNMIAAGGKLYLTGYDPTNGLQLWTSDGTQTGTTRLTGLGQTPPFMTPGIGGLTAVGSKLYFSASDESGRQLWVSDGTKAGTKRITSLGAAKSSQNPFPTGGSPAVVAVVGDRVLFAADDTATGRELWVTDGTAAGTKLVRDFHAGKGSGLWGGDAYAPAPTAAVANGRLVLSAFEPTRGAEPWSVPLADFMPASPPPAPPTPAPTPTPGARPTLVRAFPVTASEGRAFTANLASVTLPGGPTYRVTVFWGNGRTAAGTLTRMTPTSTTHVISAGHTYADPGTYAVMVRVTADTRTVLSIDTTATVADARFYAGRVAHRVTVTNPFSGVVATIQDTNPKGGKASDYTATIDWGNGRTTAGVIRQVSPGRFEVTGATAFTTVGTRTVKVTIQSVASGVTATAESIFIVDPLRPLR